MSDAADTVSARPVVPETGAGGSWASRLGLEPLRILKRLVGVLLLPICAGMAIAFHRCFWGTGTQLRVAVTGWPELFKWFMIGAGGFAAVGILLWRPMIVYAFAHEMVHALATWLCLGQVTNFRAATTGGQVTVSKSNTFIRLSPYVVPFYALLVAAVFVGCDMAGRPLRQPELMAGLLGATVAFHVGFTLYSLHFGQSDLKQDGWLFSLTVVFVANTLVLAAILGLALSGSASGAWDALRFVGEEGWRQSLSIFSDLTQSLRRAFAR
jgi:hypothetical protein